MGEVNPTEHTRNVNLQIYKVFQLFLATGDFCHLLITFANGLDPDQDHPNVGPDMDPNHLTL